MTERYDAFAREITKDGTITDPWVDGAPRFREEPIILDAREYRALCSAAERLGAVYNELCTVVRESPELTDTFFAMTPWQKAMWAASQPLWHGIARADLFLTNEGIVTAELNCDTPTGEAEAVVLGRLAKAAHPGLTDPNQGLEERFCSMIDALATRELLDAGSASTAVSGANRTIGLVYPTEFTEDLSLVRLYKRWLEARGHRVVLGSPYNLARAQDGGMSLFDTRIDVVLRHYKTDWWGERVSAWDDEELADAEPLGGPLGATLEALLERRVSIVNPFGAVLPQNKRSMAFMWEHLHRFSSESQEIIERHVPITSRCESMHGEQLRAQKDDWVLKSDYGAEGDEVTVGRLTDAATWAASLEHARKGHWIAQRYFSAKTDAAGQGVNFGVYLVAGRAAGIYARMQVGPTDGTALSCPVLVRG
jgi:glutathionylspermidine synthase